MKRLIWVIPSLLLVALPAMANTSPVQQPDQMVRKISGDILPLIKAKRAYYDADKDRLYAMVDKRIVPYFDFSETAKWILGLSWRTATPAQKKQFADELRKLLVRTYATALLKYHNQKIVYLPYTGKPTDDNVLVKTLIQPSGGGEPTKLDFAFKNYHPGWKAFDVITDRVSLIVSYRGVYRQRVQQEGLEAVIQNLAKQNREAELAGRKK